MGTISEVWMELFENKLQAESRKKEMNRFFRCIYKENNEDWVTFYRLFYLPKKDMPYDELTFKGLIENKNKMIRVEMEEFSHPKDRANKRQEKRLDYKCLSEDYMESDVRHFVMFYVPYTSYSPSEKGK